MAKASQVSVTDGVDHLYRFSVEGFNQAKDAGVFDHPERVSLVHGIVMEEPQPTAKVVTLTNLLLRHLRSALQKHFLVYGHRPLEADFYNQPTADVLVVTGQKADYQDRHPGLKDVALIVEVADTAVTYDLGGKALLYAQAAVADYWVVVEKESAIVVHREPSPGGYGSVTRLTGADTLSPLALPGAAWTISELLGRAEAL